jgi:hypothetical protein
MKVKMPPRFGVSANADAAPKATTAHNTNLKLDLKILNFASERHDTAARLNAKDL